MNERDKLYVVHIAEAIERIRRYTASGRAAFMADDMIQSAVVRQIEIMGEAARNLSSELKSGEQSVPWRKIIGTRDRLIHGYSEVNLDAVWVIVERDLAELDREVRRSLARTNTCRRRSNGPIANRRCASRAPCSKNPQPGAAAPVRLTPPSVTTPRAGARRGRR